jgi:hypothetical protein
MATPHRCSPLTRSSVVASGRLEPTIVQPVELAEFGGGLYPDVIQPIKPAIGMALDCLVLKGVTLLQHLARDKQR